MIVQGAFEKARLYIESRSKSSEFNRHRVKQGPCITISRETGAGADRVSEAIIEFFKPFNDEYIHPWTVFDKNLIEKVIEDHHLPHKLSQYFIEDRLSELKSTVNELLGIHPHTWLLVSKTTSTILQLAHIGNVVIVGRAANIITAGQKNAFHVRLVAPMENRIKHVEEICDKTRKEAIEYIHKEDQARSNYLKKYFNRDVNDLSSYHLVINTGLIPYEKAARYICEAVMETFPELFPQHIFSSEYDYA